MWFENSSIIIPIIMFTCSNYTSSKISCLSIVSFSLSLYVLLPLKSQKNVGSSCWIRTNNNHQKLMTWRCPRHQVTVFQPCAASRYALPWCRWSFALHPEGCNMTWVVPPLSNSGNEGFIGIPYSNNNPTKNIITAGTWKWMLWFRWFSGFQLGDF